MKIFPYETIEVLDHKIVRPAILSRDVVKVRILNYGWFGKLVRTEEKLVWAYTNNVSFEDVDAATWLTWEQSELIRKLLPEQRFVSGDDPYENEVREKMRAAFCSEGGNEEK